MLDDDINETLKELSKIFNDKTVARVLSHINSLTRQIEQLRESRDKWKEKYQNEVR